MARSKIALLMILLMLTASFSSAQVQAQAQTPEATETLQTPPTGLLIYNAWVRPTAAALEDGATPEPPIPGTVSGAYMTIENTSGESYRLIGVSDSIAEMTMLHQMSVDSKGVMRMQMIDHLDIPTGQTVKLDTNGYHAMLMNVLNDIYPGQAVALTLTFADPAGKQFDVPIGAIASDLPPADDSLIVANAAAVKNADGTLNLTLLLDNRSDQAETLTGAISATVTINVEQTEIPAHTQVALHDVGGLTGALRKADAFPLTLTFDSDKEITFGVPVQTSGADS